MVLVSSSEEPSPSGNGGWMLPAGAQTSPQASPVMHTMSFGHQPSTQFCVQNLPELPSSRHSIETHSSLLAQASPAALRSTLDMQAPTWLDPYDTQDVPD
jgi:hypothetical protein